MKKIFLPFLICSLIVRAAAQDKIATIDPGSGFSSVDYSAAYYDTHKEQFHVNLQDGAYLSRLLYNADFSLVDSFSYKPADISLNPRLGKRLYFLNPIAIGQENFEVYANRDKVVLMKTNFSGRTDVQVYEHPIKQAEDDERLLAVFPWKNEVKILTVSFDSSKLFVYGWQTGGLVSLTHFDLPESNVTDQKQKKEIPKIARIKFREMLNHLSVRPLRQTTLMGSPGPALYYSDNLVYIVLPTPYNLGVYVAELDLESKQFKGTNYFVNTLKDNASDNKNFHKSSSAALYDSLLIIKNASDRVYEYYFFNVNTGSLLKKYASPPGELKDLIHSEMKQKGTWASANEEKDFDSYKRFLRKGGLGTLFVSGVAGDSLTLTTVLLDPTGGVGGTLLNAMVPLELAAFGLPYYASAFLPSLGIYRNKVIYAHSRFSVKDITPSKNAGLTTVLDKLLDEKNADILSKNNSFVINRNGDYYLGYYSKDSKKIEVYKYNGNDNP